MNTQVSGKPRMKEWKGKIVQTYEEKHPLPRAERRPWYAKHGLKRTVGATILASATALVAGGQIWIGAAIGAVGGLVEGIGLLNWREKKKEGGLNKDTVATALFTWLKATVTLIRLVVNKRKEKQT